jgi:hypothetical protein
MRTVLTLAALMLLFASVTSGAGSIGVPAQTGFHALTLSEPGELVLLGVGFVLLGRQLRRKNA